MHFIKNLNLIFKRFIKKEVRLKLQERESPTKVALDYFDFYYAPLYGQEWHSIRLALLTGKKYVALVNNFADWSSTVNELERSKALNIIDYSLKQLDIETKSQTLDKFKVPKALKVYSFDTGDTSLFEQPKINYKKLLNYYCLDGASILPVLALDLKKNDHVMDLCASPGGKTLVMLQTLLPNKITCNDKTDNRIKRLNNTMKQYLSQEDIKNYIDIEEHNLDRLEKDKYDKVLVDVPCTNDRHSLVVSENNIFSKRRIYEREEIPNIQKQLLMKGIEICKIGGTIVYSTCSLSPIQNEGIINQVKDYFQNKKDFMVKVEQLDYLKTIFKYFFNFSNACKTGAMIVPSIQKNFGPIYLCKISKLSRI